ncbi:MAG TPA: hypothetical protein VFG81_18680 [Anaerolineales bacterium]|jgi:hypothetical protein|nr:hypothetical protein [Anaerolineales bacterium]
MEQAGASRKLPHYAQARAPRYFRWLVGALLSLFLLLPAGVYGWRYLYNPCEVEAVQEAADSLVIQSKMYDRVYESAVDGDRTALDYPVTVMQQTFMDTQAVVVPACMQMVKGELLSYMETVIYAFRAFRAGEANETVRNLVQRSNGHYYNFISELEAVQECAPFCFR